MQVGVISKVIHLIVLLFLLTIGNPNGFFKRFTLEKVYLLIVINLWLSILNYLIRIMKFCVLIVQYISVLCTYVHELDWHFMFKRNKVYGGNLC